MNEQNECCGGGHCGGDHKWIVMIVAILVLGTVVSFAILRDRIVSTQYRQVTVTGQGKLAYIPDMATINLGVQVDKVAKADEALNQLNNKVKLITEAVKRLGIAETDIVTNNYSLYTQYDFKDNIQVVSGYNANQQLSIKVKDLANQKDLVNKVVVEATKAGANQVNGVAFESSEIENLKQQARILAIKDAETKALALAEAADVRLKNIAGWYETLVGMQNQAMYDGKGGMGGGAVSNAVINPANNELIMEIGVSYNIK